MSRSYLKTKRFKERYSWLNEERNKHRLDEMPKNEASKSITIYCKDDIEFLNRAFHGHSTNKDRRIVSGIVRAAKKRETQKIIKEIENG